MPYATHRVVGVIELDPKHSDESDQLCESLAEYLLNAQTITTRDRIRSEVARSQGKSPLAFEPNIEVNAPALLQDLQAEVASLQTARLACI